MKPTYLRKLLTRLENLQCATRIGRGPTVQCVAGHQSHSRKVTQMAFMPFSERDAYLLSRIRRNSKDIRRVVGLTLPIMLHCMKPQSRVVIFL